MNKYIFFTALIVALFQNTVNFSASALPGWDEKKIRQWANSHDFLSPIVQDSAAGVTQSLMVRRKLEDNKQFLIRYYTGVSKKVFPRVELLVTTVSGYFWGSDPILENFWERISDKAFLLIEKAYGNGIAQDFKQSRFVFKAMDIGWENYGVGRDKDTLPDQYNPMWELEEVSFFKGKLYCYEVNANRSQLTLMSHKDLDKEISILQFNVRRYQEFLKRENRNKPAEIKL